LKGNKTEIKPSRIEVFFLPRTILDETLAYLRKHGRSNYEGFMCWSGIIVDEYDALIRSCIYPRLSQLSDYGFLRAEMKLKTVFDIGQQVYAKHEFLLAQLHTHAFKAFHSFVDDNFPISHKPGFISIVVPFFARRKFYNNKTLSNCSVNEYVGEGNWHLLEQKEVRKRFKIIGEVDEQKYEHK
jgi:hypothetical protein